MTLGDAAQYLKVSLAQLRDLEAGTYDSLPGETFIRGLIRSYCRLLEVDPDFAFRHYSYHLSLRPSSDLPPFYERPPATFLSFLHFFFQRFEFLRNPWLLFSIIFFLAVVGVAVGRLVWVHYHQDASFAHVFPKVPAISSISLNNYSPDETSVLEVRATHSSWMLVHDAQGHVVFSGELSVGQVYRVRAHAPLSVVLPDLSVIKMIYDGRPLLHPSHVIRAPGVNYIQFYLQ